MLKHDKLCPQRGNIWVSAFQEKNCLEKLHVETSLWGGH